jgi:hypothetical protein
MTNFVSNIYIWGLSRLPRREVGSPGGAGGVVPVGLLSCFWSHFRLRAKDAFLTRITRITRVARIARFGSFESGWPD